MKAIIMAAGKGTRMKELTQHVPKHLLPILGKPFLDYIIERLRAVGFTKIGIVIAHHKHAFSVYESVPDITLIEQVALHDRYGTAAAVEAAKDFVGNDSFAAVAGDNLYSANDLRKASTDTATTWIGGYRTAAWQGMGILKQDENGYLEKIVEKPTAFVGDLINATLYHFTPKIFSVIENLKPSSRNEYEITDAINTLANQEHVNVFELEDRWLDLTKPEDIEKIEKALKEGAI